MRKIHFHLGVGFAGADHDCVEEFEDDVTDEEIEESFQDWKENYLDYGWWDEDAEN